jgi:phage antirepressor YoqD-like protein
MNELMAVGNNKMMSSKEIAELTGKRHADVLRDIRKMFDDLGSANLRSEQYQVVKLDNGMTGEVSLDHDLTMLLLTGYDVKARLIVIQRWKELEQQASKPKTQLELAREQVVLLEQIEQQQALIQQQAPKAEFHDRFVRADGLHNVRQTAKVLEVPEKEFVQRCIDSGVLYRTNGKLTGYEKWVKAGYLAHKEDEINGKARPQVFFTPKGLAWIGKRIIKTEQEQTAPIFRSDAPHLAALAALGIHKPVINGIGV